MKRQDDGGESASIRRAIAEERKREADLDRSKPQSFFKYAEITDQVVKLSAQLRAFLEPEDK